MPNHVTTILTTPPHVAAALAGENGPVDFNTVVPMPAATFRGNLSKADRVAHPGDLNWYEWSISHWGTKWNAYAAEIGGTDGDFATVRFDTAWSHPFPVIDALSRRFPDQPIHVRYADEDLGSDLGEYVILDGDATRNDAVDALDGDAAADWACRIKYGQSYAELQAEWA